MAKNRVKKSSTYFHILGHVLYAVSIWQIRQHNKNVALSSAGVAAIKSFDPIYDATQSMSYCSTTILPQKLDILDSLEIPSDWRYLPAVRTPCQRVLSHVEEEVVVTVSASDPSHAGVRRHRPRSVPGGLLRSSSVAPVGRPGLRTGSSFRTWRNI